MTTTPLVTDTAPAVLATDAAQTAAKLADVRERIRELKKDEETLAAQLRAELGRGSFRSTDGLLSMTIRETRKFDASLAATVLAGTPWLPLVQRMVVDRNLAKEVLPPELFGACQAASGKDTVSFGP